MVHAPPSRSRLPDLLLDPQEAPDLEIKRWLDLARNGDDKATLAKALLALANHGGGRVILGLSETSSGSGFVPDSDRPVTLDGYSQDSVNGIVQKYAEPAFHCSVDHVKHPSSGDIHPIIGVPGGHRVPIRAKRGGPNGRIIKVNAIYVRHPGPQSAEPLTGREWDDLFKRCVDARRDELLEQIRNILLEVPQPEVSQRAVPRLERWTTDCEAAWKEKVRKLLPDSPQRFPHGYYTFAYDIDGVSRPKLGDLLDMLREAPKLTGWNTWWAPTHPPAIAPRVVDGGTIECWIGGDSREHSEHRDAAHSDFWRVSPDGLAFLRRGYQEDGGVEANAGISPGTCLDPSLPIWRTAEGLLHAAYLAGRLDGGSVSFVARYTGLRGRQLVDWAKPMRYDDWAGGVSRVDEVPLETVVDAKNIQANLADIVQSLLSPLYEHFDFTDLPLDIVQHELKSLLERR